MTFPGIEVTSVGSNNDFTSPLNLDPDPDCASISSRGTSSTVGYRYTGGFCVQQAKEELERYGRTTTLKRANTIQGP